LVTQAEDLESSEAKTLAISKLDTLKENVITKLDAQANDLNTSVDSLSLSIVLGKKDEILDEKTIALEYVKIFDSNATSVSSVDSIVDSKLDTLKENVITKLDAQANDLETTVSTLKESTVITMKDDILNEKTTALEYVQLFDSEATSVSSVDTIVDTKLNDFYANIVDLAQRYLKDNTNSDKIDATVDSVKSAEINQDYYDKMIYTYNQVSGDQVSVEKMLDILPDDFDTQIQGDLDSNSILVDKLKVIKYKVEHDYYNLDIADNISLKDIRNLNKTVNDFSTSLDDITVLATSLSDEDEDFLSLLDGVNYITLHDKTSQKAVEVLQTEISSLGSFDASGDFDTIRAFNKSSKTIDYYATKIKSEVSDTCTIDEILCSNKAMDSYNSIEATYKNSSAKLREYFDGQKSSYISDINNIFNGNSLSDSPICTGLDDCTTKLTEMLALAEDVKSELHKDEQSNLEAIYTTNSELDIKVQALKLAQVVVKIRDFNIGNIENTNNGNSRDLENYLDKIKVSDIADIFDEIKKVATEVEDYGQSFNFKRDDNDIINKNINEQSLINMRDLEDKVVSIVKNIETAIEGINGNIADTTKEKLASLVFDMTTLRQDRNITDTSLTELDDNSDYLQLGFWEYKGDNEKKNFSWITGTKTAEEKIQALIDNKQTATYNGKIYGTVITDKAIESIDSANSSVNMNFDFGSKNVDGSMKFQTVNTNWDVGFDKGSVSTTGFGVDTFSTEHSGSIKGNYYGTDAQAIGGNIKIKDISSNIAVGTFSGTKSTE
jgi:hypothetical protein